MTHSHECFVVGLGQWFKKKSCSWAFCSPPNLLVPQARLFRYVWLILRRQNEGQSLVIWWTSHA